MSEYRLERLSEDCSYSGFGRGSTQYAKYGGDSGIIAAWKDSNQNIEAAAALAGKSPEAFRRKLNDLNVPLTRDPLKK